MSEPENFLARWSRRKLDDEESVTTDKADNKARQPIQPASVPTKDAATSEGKTEPAFDLSKLPSLDSITADTDIRAFWLPGVPESLRHAALRRAWMADPGIRDFVGLAEYAWDFTATDSMRGFGPLDPAEVPRLIREFLLPREAEVPKVEDASPAPTSGEAQLTPQEAQPIPQIVESAGEGEIDTTAQASAAGANALASNKTGLPPDGSSSLLQRNEEAEKTPAQEKNSIVPLAHGRRGHGRALPQ
ncbi:MAG: DUF3306 domain-containing protein [Rhizobiales bacterium]|nr:DUF3306 domain-containing protein [Hyphomicrobiales bacterium]